MSGGTTSNFVRVDEDSDEGDPASPDQSVRARGEEEEI